jgi:magnesium transporter
MQMREIRREGFVWIDIINPTISDLKKVGETYKLDLTTIHDCLEPEHLPKFEIIENTTFIILRAYDNESNKKSDKIQTITNKVAMFFSNEFLITIHRQEQIYIKDLFDKMNSDQPDNIFSTHLLANDIIFKVGKTYEQAIHSVYELFEAFEQDVFNKNKKTKMVQSYLLKRRIDIMKRVLSLMKDPVSGLMNSAPAKARLDFKSTKEYLEKLIYQVDVVHDNLVALLSLQMAMVSQVTNEASHRANEVMRLLTVFSMFFLPINFIASLYGMNFAWMPFLKEEWGFWIAILVMVIVTLSIYLWFRRRGIMQAKDLQGQSN